MTSLLVSAPNPWFAPFLTDLWFASLLTATSFAVAAMLTTTVGPVGSPWLRAVGAVALLAAYPVAVVATHRQTALDRRSALERLGAPLVVADLPGASAAHASPSSGPAGRASANG
ncbi:hypothetical protein [Nonomuraea turcica]|uniref:hypothetical protein n=1 Tax=Nonomuraea sp. G32 TaxID=3067274 RepID=UPI00273C2839|nr:hypothetical protein [Nonomuraea sp. G32]MDP4511244.1 hypothetical protein [Nonomuraea sp. G32]